MTFRGLLLLLAIVPAVSVASPLRVAVAKRMPPRSVQGRQDHPNAPLPVARNGHLRVDVYLPSPDTVPIIVTENGVPVAVTRKLVTPDDSPVTVDLMPARELAADATVVVSVGGVRSVTYRVDGAVDKSAPTFLRATLDAVTANAPTPSPRGAGIEPPRDEVQVSVTMSDASDLRLRGVITGPDGGRIESRPLVVVSNLKPSTTLLLFPGGTVPASGTVKIRLEAIDAAGNVGTSSELEKAVAAAPAPAFVPDAALAPAPSATPAAEHRGCL
jgi:hypothetical protein